MFTTVALRWTLLTAALVAASATVPRLAAQEVLIGDPDQDAAPGELAPPSRSELIERHFDRTVFRGESPEAIVAVLNQAAAHKIEIATRDFAITPEDRLKLKLAASGDIKRFLDLVAEQRREIVQAVHLNDRELTTLAIGSSTILRDEMNVILQSHSLFAKTLRRLEAAYENEDRTRIRLGRYRKAVEYVMNGLRKPLGLSSDQRKELVTLVMTETRPLKRYGLLDSYAVLAQMARIPEDRIEEILDNTQIRKLNEYFLPARAQWTRLIDEQYLEVELTGREEADVFRELRALNQKSARLVRGQP